MILLGLLLLGAAGAFAGLLIADNLSGGPDYTVTLLGHHIATMTSLTVFLSGIALTLIFGLGLAMATGGGARMRRRGAKLREARAQARQAKADRDALQHRLDATPSPTTEGAAPARRPRRVRHMFGH
jgi:hypothetical protein